MSFQETDLRGMAKTGKTDLLYGPPGDPVIWRIHPPQSVTCRRPREAASRLFGIAATDWMGHPLSYPTAGTCAAHVDNSFFFPEWGLVFKAPGLLITELAKAARYKSPDLMQVPGATLGAAAPEFTIAEGDTGYHKGPISY